MGITCGVKYLWVTTCGVKYLRVTTCGGFAGVLNVALGGPLEASYDFKISGGWLSRDIT